MADTGMSALESCAAPVREPSSAGGLARLDHFGLLQFSGVDAGAFLHAQLSCDVTGLPDTNASYGAYCSPQGRVFANFLLWRDPGGFVMMLPRERVVPLAKRLSMFVLRSKVNIADVADEFTLFGVVGAESERALVAHFEQIPDAPLALVRQGDATMVRLDRERVLLALPRATAQALAGALPLAPIGAERWRWLDIRGGIPWVLAPTQEALLPQWLNLDLLGAVSFRKGCYPGQEVIARVRYRGRSVRRLFLAHSPEPAAAGEALYREDLGAQACGTVVNAESSSEGGCDLLASLPAEGARAAVVTLRSPNGPRLRLSDPPYPLE